jgi:glycosyltransferase involved in cell wall biosynthesis
MKKIKYLFTYPFSMDLGGGGVAIRQMVRRLERQYDIDYLDYNAEEIDFETLIVFGCTYWSPEVLRFYRNKGVNIVSIPIFDRMHPVWLMRLLSPLIKFPILNAYSLRAKILAEASHILVHNKSEWRDLEKIYGADPKKMKLFHYGISDEFFEIADSISPDLFYNEYKLKNFVFIPAAAVSKRKNQLTLIKALKGTNTHLVINNTNKIQDGLEQEFNTLTKNDPYIHCLESLSFKMLISAYKNAKVSVSLSQAETAGLVNLEAAYLGCNLVVSKLEAFYEYLKGYATFVDQNNPEVVRKAVLEAMQKDYDPSVREFIEKNYTWDVYIEELRALL